MFDLRSKLPQIRQRQPVRYAIVLGLLVLQMLAIGLAATTQFASAAPAAAGIILNKKAGPPTSAVIVNGSGYAPTEVVNLSFDATSLGSVATAGGAFSTTITIPASALPGNHSITAKGATSALSAAAAFIVRTNWTQFAYAAGHSGVNPYENVLNTATVAGLPVKWSAGLGAKVISSPAVSTGIVYIGSSNNKLYAINASTHTLRWAATTGGPITSSPAVSAGIVVVGSGDGKVYGFDASTGAQTWSVTTGGAVTSSPAVSGGVAYIGSADGKLYAIDSTTGAVNWSVSTGAPVSTSPAVNTKNVYVTNADGLFVYSLTTHALSWHASLHVSNSPSLYKNTVVVGTPLGGVVAYNATSGVRLWVKGLGGAINSTAAIDGIKGIVYVGSTNKNVYALAIGTGATLWAKATGGAVTSSPALANGVLYVGSWDGKIYGFNAANGTIVWSFATGGSVESSPAVSDGIVYVGSDSMRIYAFGR